MSVSSRSATSWIHGYDLVDDDLVWETIQTKLPVLLIEIEELLKRESP